MDSQLIKDFLRTQPLGSRLLSEGVYCQGLLVSSVCLLGPLGVCCFTLKFCFCLKPHVLSSVVPQVDLIIPST